MTPPVQKTPYIGRRRNKNHERAGCLCIDCLRDLRKEGPKETKTEEMERYNFDGRIAKRAKREAKREVKKKV